MHSRLQKPSKNYRDEPIHDGHSIKHGSLNVPIEHHPTIRYMVYNGYYKVMSNIPKMGKLPTLVKSALLFHTLGGQWDDRDTLLEDVIYRPRKTDFAHPGKPILKSAECARQSLDLFEISSWAYRGPQKSPNHLLLGFRAYIYIYIYIIYYKAIF